MEEILMSNAKRRTNEESAMEIVGAYLIDKEPEESILVRANVCKKTFTKWVKEYGPEVCEQIAREILNMSIELEKTRKENRKLEQRNLQLRRTITDLASCVAEDNVNE